MVFIGVEDAAVGQNALSNPLVRAADGLEGFRGSVEIRGEWIPE